jgi:hypothetical protein
LVDEQDEQIGDLQYRDVFVYVIGHGVSAAAVVDKTAAASTCLRAEYRLDT